jgi:zinc protease
MSAALRPAPSPARHYSFPGFERHQLENGLKILVAPVPKLPLVTISALVDAGAECDPWDKSGLAHITAQLLTEGAGAMDGVALTDHLERMGSSLDAAADWDAAGVSLSVMSQRFTEAVRTLADVLVRPALPERELERLKGERLAELLQVRTEPRSLADEAFAAIVYDDSSRYAKPVAGSEKSVRTLGITDVRDFHGARYTPGTTTIVVAGDVQVSEAVAVIGDALGMWRGTASPRPQLNVAAARAATRVHLVGKEGAPQSELRLGGIGLPRVTPDYFDVVVMNAILGGLFSSRLNLNLRERHGYTYGAFSTFQWRRHAGPFIIATAVRNDVTVESIREVLSEVNAMREELVSDDELSLAINYLSGVFPIRFETTAAIASALATLAIYGLPSDFYDSYRDKISAVTRQSVLNAARKYLRVDELEIVVVGDPAAVHGPLGEFAAQGLDVRDSRGILA